MGELHPALCSVLVTCRNTPPCPHSDCLCLITLLGMPICAVSPPLMLPAMLPWAPPLAASSLA